MSDSEDDDEAGGDAQQQQDGSGPLVGDEAPAEQQQVDPAASGLATGLGFD
jgi:hypothetical protein